MAEEAEIKPTKYASQIEELGKLLPKLQKESDLGVVLVLCSYLDALLRDMLFSFLIDSDSTTRLVEKGPLGTFGARIMTTYYMGIINKKEIDHLDDIKDIRNQFAHKHDINFEDMEIKKLCDKLYIKHMGIEDDTILPSLKFRAVAIDLITKFGNRVDYLKNERLETKVWDDVKW